MSLMIVTKDLAIEPELCRRDYRSIEEREGQEQEYTCNVCRNERENSQRIACLGHVSGVSFSRELAGRGLIRRLVLTAIPDRRLDCEAGCKVFAFNSPALHTTLHYTTNLLLSGRSPPDSLAPATDHSPPLLPSRPEIYSSRYPLLHVSLHIVPK